MAGPSAGETCFDRVVSSGQRADRPRRKGIPNVAITPPFLNAQIARPVTIRPCRQVRSRRTNRVSPEIGSKYGQFAIISFRIAKSCPISRHHSCFAAQGGVNMGTMHGFVYFDIHDRARLPQRFYGETLCLTAR